MPFSSTGFKILRKQAGENPGARHLLHTVTAHCHQHPSAAQVLLWGELENQAIWLRASQECSPVTHAAPSSPWPLVRMKRDLQFCDHICDGPMPLQVPLLWAEETCDSLCLKQCSTNKQDATSKGTRCQVFSPASLKTQLLNAICKSVKDTWPLAAAGHVPAGRGTFFQLFVFFMSYCDWQSLFSEDLGPCVPGGRVQAEHMDRVR
jgi:hypothetical protein